MPDRHRCNWLTIPKRSSDRCPTHPGAFLREMVLPAVSASKVAIAASAGNIAPALYDILPEKQHVHTGDGSAPGAVLDTSPHRGSDAGAYDLWHAEREVDTPTAVADEAG